MTEGERRLEAVREQMEECGAPQVPEVSRVVVRGGSLLLRSLTAERIAAIWAWRRANRTDTAGLYARLIVPSLADASGEPLLSAADIPSVETWPAVQLEAIADAIIRHNHMN